MATTVFENYEKYDPYLASFIRDVGSGISLVFQTIGIIIRASCFVGSKVVEGTIWTFETGSSGYYKGTEIADAFRSEIMEFGGSFFRAILLIGYGVNKIVESFFITAVDFYSLCCHVVHSIRETISGTSLFVVKSLTGIFTVVPQHLVEALSMIGESVISFKSYASEIIQDFLLQLVMSPINAIITIAGWIVKLIMLPINVVSKMPPSSFLGLLVVLLIAFLCRKLVGYFVVRNIGAVFRNVVSVLHKLLSLIRYNRLRNFVTSSVVWTIVRMHNPGSSGSVSTKATCVICQDKPVTYMSDPCKHVCLCEVCVYDLLEHDNRCPICRGRVRKYDRVFIP